MDTTKNVLNESKMFKIYPDTILGKNVLIGEYVILGVPARKQTEKLKIGDNAVIRSHSIIYAGNTIENNFQTGHGVFIQENNKIGEQVSLGTKSVIIRDCIIEEGVRIHTQVFIPEYSVIRKRAWIGPNVVLTNTRHPTCIHAKECMQNTGVEIEERAIIGANATILSGITIKEGAIVGAGSVVVENVPKESVVVGNPAKKIKNRKDIKCISKLTNFPYNDF